MHSRDGHPTSFFLNMSVQIIFESHATTTDNEAGLASGWNDVELSELGLRQARDLGERRRADEIDAVFCSDLQRSYRTAWVAFEGRDMSVFIDWRLREADYGDRTKSPSWEVGPQKPEHIVTPFPGGESYEQTTERMRSFLRDLLTFHNGKRVMVIGHRATQYALEHLISNKPLGEIVPASWTWQPGWEYTLTTV